MSRERVEIEFEAARVVKRAFLTARVVGPDEGEEAEGADDVASVRFRLRVSIQNRTANRKQGRRLIGDQTQSSNGIFIIFHKP